MTHKDWNTDGDDKGDVEIPDELMPLFNKLGMQLRFHTISDKPEAGAILDMVWIAQKFFTEHPELCKP
jgi:hypothetical protein